MKLKKFRVDLIFFQNIKKCLKENSYGIIRGPNSYSKAFAMDIIAPFCDIDDFYLYLKNE